MTRLAYVRPKPMLNYASMVIKKWMQSRLCCRPLVVNPFWGACPNPDIHMFVYIYIQR